MPDTFVEFGRHRARTGWKTCDGLHNFANDFTCAGQIVSTQQTSTKNTSTYLVQITCVNNNRAKKLCATTQQQKK